MKKIKNIFKKRTFTLEQYITLSKKGLTEYSNPNEFANPWDFNNSHLRRY